MLARFVMIGHDHVHAVRQQLRDLVGRGYAAVHGHHEVRRVLQHAFDRRGRQTVALTEPVRHDRFDRRPKRCKTASRHRRSADAVEVEVTEYENALIGLHCPSDALSSRVHSWDQRRVEPVPPQRWLDEALRLLGALDPT